jgi:hypothetical protein
MDKLKRSVLSVKEDMESEEKKLASRDAAEPQAGG